MVYFNPEFLTEIHGRNPEQQNEVAKLQNFATFIIRYFNDK